MSTLQLARHQVVHQLHVVMHANLRQCPRDEGAPLAMRLCTVRCNCGCWIRSYWNVTTAEALNQIAADAEEHLLDDDGMGD